MRLKGSLFLIFFYVTAGLAVAGRAVGARTADLLQRGYSALKQGDPAGAEPLLREAVQQARLAGDGESRAGATNALGVALRRQGRYLEAEAAFAGALTMLERLGPGHETAVAAAYANLGLTRVSLRKPGRARQALDRAVAMLTQQGDHARAAAALTSLGALHHQLRDWPQARAAFSRALELYLAAGPAGPETAVCHNGLGSAAFESGRLHEAVLHFEAALEQYGDDPGLAPWRAKTLANLGRVTLPLGDPSRSESLLQRALAIQEAALGPHHPDLAVTLGYLAQAEAMRGEKHRSAALRKRAKAIRAQAYDANGGGATVDVSAWMGRPR